MLSEKCYQHVTRGYADLDILVPAQEIRSGERALEEVGSVVPRRDWHLLVNNAKGELTMSTDGWPLIDMLGILCSIGVQVNAFSCQLTSCWNGVSEKYGKRCAERGRIC